MPRTLRPETFIALRARRKAHEIARDIVNPHVDVTAVPCRACGQDVPIAHGTSTSALRCPNCRVLVALPAGLAAVVDQPREDDPSSPAASEGTRPSPVEWTPFQWILATALAVLFMGGLLALALTLN